jgi:2-amino-4-hydroxy-6-hydroxymethyldihydropteridine diphosphokinase
LDDNFEKRDSKGKSMPCSFVALGGNQGPVSETFQNALERLDNDPSVTVQRISRFYRTAPVGDDAGREFLNAAAEIETDLEPIPLLDLLQTIETESGRIRAVHWGPRTLDLDLILYGEKIIDLPKLQIPHPACWYRRFVLDPLAEIAAETLHPLKKLTFGELRSRLEVRPLPVALAGSNDHIRKSLIDNLSQEFPEVAMSNWMPSTTTEILPALVIWLGEDQNTVTGSHTKYRTLPEAARLDASTTREKPETFLRSVLQSALDEVRAVES